VKTNDHSDIDSRAARPTSGTPAKFLAVAVAGTLVLAGCSGGRGGAGPETVVTTVTQSSQAPTPPTISDPGTPTSEMPPSRVTPSADDAGWFTEADRACALAIDEYASWKAAAGHDPAPEALALGAAAAATHAADTIEALPRPGTEDGLTLREAVTAWAAAYREMASAMDHGSYSEVTAAGDAAQTAGDQLRSVAGTSAPSCAAMVHEV
jgi:hypothetical protein